MINEGESHKKQRLMQTPYTGAEAVGKLLKNFGQISEAVSRFGNTLNAIHIAAENIEHEFRNLASMMSMTRYSMSMSGNSPMHGAGAKRTNFPSPQERLIEFEVVERAKNNIRDQLKQERGEQPFKDNATRLEEYEAFLEEKEKAYKSHKDRMDDLYKKDGKAPVTTDTKINEYQRFLDEKFQRLQTYLKKEVDLHASIQQARGINKVAIQKVIFDYEEHHKAQNRQSKIKNNISGSDYVSGSAPDYSEMPTVPKKKAAIVVLDFETAGAPGADIQKDKNDYVQSADIIQIAAEFRDDFGNVLETFNVFLDKRSNDISLPSKQGLGGDKFAGLQKAWQEAKDNGSMVTMEDAAAKLKSIIDSIVVPGVTKFVVKDTFDTEIVQNNNTDKNKLLQPVLGPFMQNSDVIDVQDVFKQLFEKEKETDPSKQSATQKAMADVDSTSGGTNYDKQVFTIETMFKALKKPLEDLADELKESSTDLGDFHNALGDVRIESLLYLFAQRKLKTIAKEAAAKNPNPAKGSKGNTASSTNTAPKKQNNNYASNGGVQKVEVVAPLPLPVIIVGGGANLGGGGGNGGEGNGGGGLPTFTVPLIDIDKFIAQSTQAIAKERENQAAAKAGGKPASGKNTTNTTNDFSGGKPLVPNDNFKVKEDITKNEDLEWINKLTGKNKKVDNPTPVSKPSTEPTTPVPVPSTSTFIDPVNKNITVDPNQSLVVDPQPASTTSVNPTPVSSPMPSSAEIPLEKQKSPELKTIRADAKVGNGTVPIHVEDLDMENLNDILAFLEKTERGMKASILANGGKMSKWDMGVMADRTGDINSVKNEIEKRKKAEEEKSKPKPQATPSKPTEAIDDNFVAPRSELSKTPGSVSEKQRKKLKDKAWDSEQVNKFSEHDAQVALDKQDAAYIMMQHKGTTREQRKQKVLKGRNDEDRAFILQTAERLDKAVWNPKLQGPRPDSIYWPETNEPLKDNINESPVTPSSIVTPKPPASAKEIPPVTEPTPLPKPEAPLSRIDRQRAAQKDVTAPAPVQSVANTTFSKNFVKGMPSKEPLTKAMQEMMASFQTLMSPVLSSAKLDTTAAKPGAEGTTAFDALNDNAQKLVSTFQKMFGIDLTKISNFSASAFGPDATKGEGWHDNFAAGLFNRKSNAIKIRQGANEKGEAKDESFGTLLHESIHAMFGQLRKQTKVPNLGKIGNIDFGAITGGNKEELKAIEVMYTDLLDKAKNAFIEALAIQNYGSASKANITKATEDMKGMDYFSQPEEIVATMIGDVFKGRIKQEGLFSDKNTSWLSRKGKRKPNSVENSSTLSKGFGFVKNLFGFGNNDEAEEMFDEGSQTDFTQMSLPRDEGKTPQSTRQPKAGPGLLKRSASSFAGMTGKLKNNAIALGKKSFGYLKNKTKGGFNAFFNPQQENAKVLAQVITPIVAGIATSLVTLAAGADPLTAATAGGAIAGTTGALAQTKNIAKGLTTTAKGIKDVSVELGSGLGELASDLYKAGKKEAISTGANIASFGVTAGSKIATTAIALKNQLKTIGAKIAGPASAIGKDILNTGIIGSSKEAMRLTGGIGKDIQAGALLAGAGIKKLGISLATKTKSVASVITKFATSKATSAGKGISKFTTKQIFNPAKAGLNTFTESGYLLKAVSSQILKKALNKAAPAFEIGKDIYNTGIVGSSKEAMRLFGEIGNDLTSGFSKAGSGLKKVGKGSVNLASKGGASLKAGVKSAFKFSTNLASTLGTGFVDGTKQSSSLLISGLKDEVKNSPLIKAASFLIKGTMSGVKESSSMMFGGAKEDISKLFQGAMSRGNKAYKGIKGFGNNALAGAKNVGGSILGSVTNKFSTMSGSMIGGVLGSIPGLLAGDASGAGVGGSLGAIAGGGMGAMFPTLLADLAKTPKILSDKAKDFVQNNLNTKKKGGVFSQIWGTGGVKRPKVAIEGTTPVEDTFKDAQGQVEAPQTAESFFGGLDDTARESERAEAEQQRQAAADKKQKEDAAKAAAFKLFQQKKAKEKADAEAEAEKVKQEEMERERQDRRRNQSTNRRANSSFLDNTREAQQVEKLKQLEAARLDKIRQAEEAEAFRLSDAESVLYNDNARLVKEQDPADPYAPPVNSVIDNAAYPNTSNQSKPKDVPFLDQVQNKPNAVLSNNNSEIFNRDVSSASSEQLQGDLDKIADLLQGPAKNSPLFLKMARVQQTKINDQLNRLDAIKRGMMGRFEGPMGPFQSEEDQKDLYDQLQFEREYKNLEQPIPAPAKALTATELIAQKKAELKAPEEPKKEDEKVLEKKDPQQAPGKRERGENISLMEALSQSFDRLTGKAYTKGYDPHETFDKRADGVAGVVSGAKDKASNLLDNFSGVPDIIKGALFSDIKTPFLPKEQTEEQRLNGGKTYSYTGYTTDEKGNKVESSGEVSANSWQEAVQKLNEQGAIFVEKIAEVNGGMEGFIRNSLRPEDAASQQNSSTVQYLDFLRDKLNTNAMNNSNTDGSLTDQGILESNKLLQEIVNTLIAIRGEKVEPAPQKMDAETEEIVNNRNLDNASQGAYSRATNEVAGDIISGGAGNKDTTKPIPFKIDTDNIPTAPENFDFNSPSEPYANLPFPNQPIIPFDSNNPDSNEAPKNAAPQSPEMGALLSGYQQEFPTSSLPVKNPQADASKGIPQGTIDPQNIIAPNATEPVRPSLSPLDIGALLDPNAKPALPPSDTAGESSGDKNVNVSGSVPLDVNILNPDALKSDENKTNEIEGVAQPLDPNWKPTQKADDKLDPMAALTKPRAVDKKPIPGLAKGGIIGQGVNKFISKGFGSDEDEGPKYPDIFPRYLAQNEAVLPEDAVKKNSRLVGDLLKGKKIKYMKKGGMGGGGSAPTASSSGSSFAAKFDPRVLFPKGDIFGPIKQWVGDFSNNTRLGFIGKSVMDFGKALQGSLNGIAGFVKAASPDAFSTLTGSIQLLMGAIGVQFIPIIIRVSAILQQWYQEILSGEGVLGEFIAKVAGWVNEMPEDMLEGLVGIGLVIAGIVALAPVFAGLMAVVGIVAGAFSLLMTALGFVATGFITLVTFLGTAFSGVATAVGIGMAPLALFALALLAAVEMFTGIRGPITRLGEAIGSFVVGVARKMGLLGVDHTDRNDRSGKVEREEAKKIAKAYDNPAQAKEALEKESMEEKEKFKELEKEAIEAENIEKARNQYGQKAPGEDTFSPIGNTLSWAFDSAETKKLAAKKIRTKKDKDGKEVEMTSEDIRAEVDASRRRHNALETQSVIEGQKVEELNKEAPKDKDGKPVVEDKSKKLKELQDKADAMLNAPKPEEGSLLGMKLPDMSSITTGFDTLGGKLKDAVSGLLTSGPNGKSKAEEYDRGKGLNEALVSTYSEKTKSFEYKKINDKEFKEQEKAQSRRLGRIGTKDQQEDDVANSTKFQAYAKVYTKQKEVEEEKKKEGGQKALAMSFSKEKAQASFSSVDEAYKKIQVSALGDDPMTAEMKKLNEIGMIKLLEELRGIRAGDKQNADKIVAGGGLAK